MSTYTVYGKLYNVADLERAIDEGFDRFLYTTKRGLKDQKEFREAKANMMAGIKDGSIVYENGRFVDKQGRYTNSDKKNKNKDHYGLVANYFQSHLGKSEEVKPEKWEGAKNIGKALTDYIFNSDKYNVNDFIVEDTPETGRANRSKKLIDGLTYIRDQKDFSSIPGYDENEKAKYAQYINDAINVLSQDGFTDDDLLELSRATGIDMRSWFGIGKLKEQDSEQDSEQEEEYDATGKRIASPQENPQIAFARYLNLYHPYYTGELRQPVIYAPSPFRLSPEATKQMTTAMYSMSDEDLERIVNEVFVNNNQQYNFDDEIALRNLFGDAFYGFNLDDGIVYSMNELIRRGKLQQIEGTNKYYVPFLQSPNQETVYVYDTDKHSFEETNTHKIPFMALKMRDEFVNDTYGIDNFTVYQDMFKKGGILKAKNGLSTTSRGANLPVNYSNYENTLENSRALDKWDNWFKNDLIDTNFEQHLQTANLNQLVNALNGIQTDGLDFIKGYASDGKSLKTGYTAFNEAFNKTGLNGMYFDYTDADKDELGVSTYNRNLFLNRWKDKLKKQAFTRSDGSSISYDGTKFVYTPNSSPYSFGSNKSNNPDTSMIPQAVKDIAGQIDVSKVSSTSGNTEGSKIYETVTKNPKPYDFSELAWLGPNALSVLRYIKSVRTNNKNAELLKRTPVLQTNALRYSPLQGDFAASQQSQQRAGLLHRTGNEATTSDASLQIAKGLEYNKAAMNEVAKGQMADNQALRADRKENEAITFENAKIRANDANINRKNIHDTNEFNDTVEAKRNIYNNASTQELLGSMERDLATKTQDWITKNKAYKQSSYDYVAQQQYNSKARELSNRMNIARSQWDETIQGPFTNSTIYQQYLQDMLDAADWYHFQTSGNYARMNALPDRNNRLYGTPLIKNGGKLIDLINKVIKNEHNT